MNLAQNVEFRPASVGLVFCYFEFKTASTSYCLTKSYKTRGPLVYTNARYLFWKRVYRLMIFRRYETTSLHWPNYSKYGSSRYTPRYYCSSFGLRAIRTRLKYSIVRACVCVTRLICYFVFISFHSTMRARRAIKLKNVFFGVRNFIMRPSRKKKKQNRNPRQES